jgi:hypothetical protein
MEPSPPGQGEPRRSRFEDLSDVTPPAPMRGRPGRRPAIVTTAAVVLFVSALMNGAAAGLLSLEGSSLWVSAGLAIAQLVGAMLVALLLPIGRPLGIVLGVVGIVMGLSVALAGGATSGLITMGLNGFVVYALAASGPSFRRG